MASSWKTLMPMFWVLMATGAASVSAGGGHRNAYATMMYMGTPRDYEFYVAIRVMLRSLAKLRADADLVVIASRDVPLRWIHTLEEEDGAKVVRVENLNNPYQSEGNHDRFKLSLNKVYAWSLVEYERVVMLDADNLFLRNTDELFQCGHFCAVFINPCIFHTGLFVLQPSSKVFKNMLHDLDMKRSNPDAADQGFIGGYFPDLLDQPMFHPPPNASTKLQGTFRLPLGYQMDASYFYLKLRWSVPCGPNSVITFPSAPWLKPWYWWSWPVLPLGIQWHQQRRQTLGYDSEMGVVVIQSVVYLGIIAITRLGLGLGRPAAATASLTKLHLCCYRTAGDAAHVDNNNKKKKKIISIIQTSLIMLFILISYLLPIWVIPHTIHPIVGWSLYLLGSFALSGIPMAAFLLPALPVLTPWMGIVGVLVVMAFPWYNDGVVRALCVFAYAFCASPLLWISLGKIINTNIVSSREFLFLPCTRLATHDPTHQPGDRGLNKLY